MADTRMTRPLAPDLCQHDVARRHRHDRQVKTFLTELAGQADQRTAQLREMFSATPKRIELEGEEVAKINANYQRAATYSVEAAADRQRLQRSGRAYQDHHAKGV